jgi:cytochrome c2
MLGTPLHAASRFGRVDAIKKLLEAGTDPDVRDRDGFTALMKAVIENRRTAVEALLIGGANVDAVLNGRGGRGVGRGQTIALQLAIQFGRSDIADILRAAGAGAIPPDVPAQLLANGDPERGREFAYKDCDGCHTIAAGDPPRSKTDGEGPPLVGVIDRPVASLTDFDYSDALIAHSGKWTPERFFAFALSPTLTVPGTHMFWSFDRTPELVADITAYFVSEAE